MVKSGGRDLARKVALICLAFFANLSSYAQNSPATLPNVQISLGGNVSAVVVQDDGKIVIGGSFSSVSGVPRVNIARINVDGSVDEGWNPPSDVSGFRNGYTSYFVSALAISGTNLFIGQHSANSGGTLTEARVFKLNTSGTGEPDPMWSPDLRGDIRAMAASGNDLFVAGGPFTTSTTSNIPQNFYLNFARIGFTGSAPVDHLLFTDRTVGIVAMSVGNDSIYLGGFFSSIGKLNNQIYQGFLAKVERLTGEVDAVWIPSVSGDIHAIAINGTNLFIGGEFDSIGGKYRTNLAKLDAYGTGSVDSVWAPNPNNLPFQSQVKTLAISGSDIYVGGSFTNVGGQSRPNLARVSTIGNGLSDPYWDPQPDSEVAAIAVDGTRIYVGGSFTRMRGKTALGVARLGSLTGLRDGGFSVQVEKPGYINAIVRQRDGKIIIGGSFNLVDKLGRGNMARFHLDGTLDPVWDPDVDGTVSALAVTETDIIAGGYFRRVGGKERQNLAKISAGATATVNPAWNPGTNLPPETFGVTLLAVNGTNLYLALRQFFSFLPFKSLVTRLSATSGLMDATWNPTNIVVWDDLAGITSMAATETGLFVMGSFIIFDQTNGIAGIAKLLPGAGGNADSVWNPGAHMAFPGPLTKMALSGTNLYLSSSGFNPSSSNNQLIAKFNAEGSGAPEPLWSPPLAQTGPPPVLLGVSGTNLYAYGTFSNGWGGFITNIVKLDTSGTGAMDERWNFPLEATASRVGLIISQPGYGYVLGYVPFLAVGRDVYLGATGLGFIPIADAPTMVKRSATNLLILRNPEDGYEVTHFRIIRITGGTLYQSDGQTQIHPGDFITIQQGESGVVFQGATNGTVSAVSALNDAPDGAGTRWSTLNLSAPQSPIFRFSAAEYRVAENSNAVQVTIHKLGEGPANVNVVTADALAVSYDYDSDSGDYYAINPSATLSFPSWPTNKSFLVFINDDAEFEGEESFWLMLTNATGGARLAYPATASVVIIDDEPFGETKSFTTSRPPDQPPGPELRGGLQVNLEPSFGQWRLAGELDWRNSGQVVSNLEATIYEMEFKPLTNYYDLGVVQVAIRAGTNLAVSLSYKAKPDASTGRLSVGLTPIDVSQSSDETNRGQWHVLGEESGVWHDSGQIVSNLPAGVHIVQFKSIPNFAAPLDREVTVLGNAQSTLSASYLELDSSGVLLPHVLSFNGVTNANWPFRYNGQIQTEAGFSSGVVVKERVVLTVAHGLFDDYSLDWVPGARWFFQKHGSDNAAPPQFPRGWYVLSGYAAQRTNDLRAGTSPGSSTRASQQLDAAALYFVESEYDANRPGRGGFGGYLSSDAGLDNEHFLNDWNKMLVGYPFDPQTTGNCGKMHATPPGRLVFRFLNPKVFVTDAIRSFPGNSGGPLYVQWTNGTYYPAGIYLGGAAETLVRVIDSAVVDLINRAEASGSDGGNHTGGGVIRIDRGSSSAGSWKLIVKLGPEAAVRAGAKWRGGTRQEFTTADVDFDSCQAGQTNQTTLEFDRAYGWSLPVYSTNLDLICGKTLSIEADYAVDPPQLTFDYQTGLRLSATTGTTYQVETSSNLLQSWDSLTTIFLTNSPVALTNIRPANTGQLFYRVRWVP